MSDRETFVGLAIHWSWQAQGTVEAISMALPNLTLAVASQSAAELNDGLATESVAMRIATAQPEVMSIPVGRPPMKVVSFAFKPAERSLGRNNAETASGGFSSSSSIEPR